MRRLVLAVADRFSKLPWEVEELSPDELTYCVAYINVTAREQKREQDKAKEGGGSRKARR